MLFRGEKQKLKEMMIDEFGVEELKDVEIKRNDLIDWFLKKQKRTWGFCADITVKELIETAESVGIKRLGKGNRRNKNIKVEVN